MFHEFSFHMNYDIMKNLSNFILLSAFKNRTFIGPVNVNLYNHMLAETDLALKTALSQWNLF